MEFIDLNLARKFELTEARIGESLVHSMQQRMPQAGAASTNVAGGIATFTGIDSPISQVIGAGLDENIPEPEVDRLEDFFRTRGAPAILELSSFAAPSFVETLNRRGYVVVEFSHVLCRKCGQNEQFALAPSEITIRELAPQMRPDEARLYTEVVSQGFAESLPITQDLLDVVEGFCTTRMAVAFLPPLTASLQEAAQPLSSRALAPSVGRASFPNFGVAESMAHSLPRG